jgi:hypothetical protein
VRPRQASSSTANGGERSLLSVSMPIFSI